MMGIWWKLETQKININNVLAIAMHYLLAQLGKFHSLKWFKLFSMLQMSG